MELNFNCENEIIKTLLPSIKPKQSPNLNQNVWILVIAFVSIGIGEYFDLYTLFGFGVILSIFSLISILFTLVAYTINYWKKKLE